MPYVRCPSCGLQTFSVAYRADLDHCGACDAELPRPQRRDLIRLLPEPSPHRAAVELSAPAERHAQRH